MAEELDNKDVKLSDDGLLNSYFESYYTPEELSQMAAKPNDGTIDGVNDGVKTPEQIESEKIASEIAAKELAAKEESEKIQAAINKAIEEKTAGRFKSVDELASIPTYKEPEFVNEESKTLYEALLADKKDVVLKYLQESVADYSKVSDLDLLKSKYKSEFPYVNDEDAIEEIKDKYNLDLVITDLDKETLSASDLAEKEKKIARAQRVVKREAEEYRKKLQENKPTLEIPKPADKPAEQSVSQEDEGVKIWMESIEGGANALPESINHSLAIEIGDGDDKVSYSTDFKIEGEDKKALADYVRTFVPPLGREAEYVKDGKVDVQRITTEGIDKLFSKKMYTALLKESVAKAQKSIVESLKNIDDTPAGQNPKPPVTEEDFLSKAISF